MSTNETLFTIATMMANHLDSIDTPNPKLSQALVKRWDDEINSYCQKRGRKVGAVSRARMAAKASQICSNNCTPKPLPLSDFQRRPDIKAGYAGICKKCTEQKKRITAKSNLQLRSQSVSEQNQHLKNAKRMLCRAW